MMTKFKHNKKRNSAFLYEALIQELAKVVISKNKKSQTQITKIIKESFSRNSMLYRELKLYRAITHTNGVGVITAEKIINEVKIRHKEINKKQLLSEQNKLIKKINKFLSKNVFSNFVPNYKSLASISQIFNKNVSIKSKVLLENEIVGKMSLRESKEHKMVAVDNLVFKSFVKKFNEEYKGKLLNEQKILLNKFITSFQNNGLELKIYLNEEVSRLKKEISASIKQENVFSDEQMFKNAKEVLGILESYKEKRPDQAMVEEVIKIQELTQELKANAN